MLLDGHREVGSTLDRGIIGDEDTRPVANLPDANDDPSGRRLPHRGPSLRATRSPEGGSWIDDPFDAFPWQELPSRPMSFDGSRATTFLHEVETGSEVVEQSLVVGAPLVTDLLLRVVP